MAEPGGAEGVSLLRCQGPTNQQSTVSNHRATALAAGEPDSWPHTDPAKLVQGRDRDMQPSLLVNQTPRPTQTLRSWCRGETETCTHSGSPGPYRSSPATLSCAPTPIAAGRAEELSQGPGPPRHVPRKVLPICHSAPFTSHAWPRRVVHPHYQRSTLQLASDLRSYSPPSALLAPVPGPSFMGSLPES